MLQHYLSSARALSSCGHIWVSHIHIHANRRGRSRSLFATRLARARSRPMDTRARGAEGLQAPTATSNLQSSDQNFFNAALAGSSRYAAILYAFFASTLKVAPGSLPPPPSAMLASFGYRLSNQPSRPQDDRRARSGTALQQGLVCGSRNPCSATYFVQKSGLGTNPVL